MFCEIRSTVGDDIFDKFLNLKSDESMALVIDVSGSMSGESLYNWRENWESGEVGWGGGGVRVCYEMVMSFAKIILLNQSLCFSMNYFFSQNDTVSLSQCM